MDKIDKIYKLIKNIKNSDESIILDHVIKLEEYLDNLYINKEEFLKFANELIDEKNIENIKKIKLVLIALQTGDFCNLSSGPQRECPYDHNCKRKSLSHHLLCHINPNDHWTTPILDAIERKSRKRESSKREWSKRKTIKKRGRKKQKTKRKN